jgi:hypothetical protein
VVEGLHLVKRLHVVQGIHLVEGLHLDQVDHLGNAQLRDADIHLIVGGPGVREPAIPWSRPDP